MKIDIDKNKNKKVLKNISEQYQDTMQTEISSLYNQSINDQVTSKYSKQYNKFDPI